MMPDASRWKPVCVCMRLCIVGVCAHAACVYAYSTHTRTQCACNCMRVVLREYYGYVCVHVCNVCNGVWLTVITCTCL